MKLLEKEKPQQAKPENPVRDYPASAPVRIDRPVMLHTWSELGFLHWRYDPEVVQRLLPPSLTVDTFDGSAWVGLVPFHCTITPPGIPRIPWVSSFEEMNVRTYVRGPDGVPGVWFITLDAARLGAVLIARTTYRLRYFWSKMAFSRVGDVTTYRSKRRWPKRSRALGTIAMQVGPALEPDELRGIDHFLTGRWAFYTTLGRRLYRAYIEHEPWPLARASLLHCDPDLVTAGGLPAPNADPLVLHSKRVHVRMGVPRRVRQRARRSRRFAGDHL